MGLFRGYASGYRDGITIPVTVTVTVRITVTVTVKVTVTGTVTATVTATTRWFVYRSVLPARRHARPRLLLCLARGCARSKPSRCFFFARERKGKKKKREKPPRPTGRLGALGNDPPDDLLKSRRCCFCHFRSANQNQGFLFSQSKSRVFAVPTYARARFVTVD